MDSMVHNDASSLREQYLEYGFLDGVCRIMWQRGILMDVLRSHTDQSGYDILLEAGSIQRHVQLKSSFLGAKTARQKVNLRLADRPSGCVVWIRFDSKTLEQREFLWFGGAPGEPVPDLGERVAKHSKGNAYGMKLQRTGIRILNKGQFERIVGFEELTKRLFEH